MFNATTVDARHDGYTAGYSDYEAGTETPCPHPPDSDAAREWRDGYRAGVDEAWEDDDGGICLGDLGGDWD